MTNENNCQANYPIVYGNCRGQIRQQHFVWHVIPRPEFNEIMYDTILTCEICDNHYNMILTSNNGKKPNAYGHNEIDAIDCLLEHCSK